MTPEQARTIARERNRREGLGPIADPAVLRLVALKLAAWRERVAKGRAATAA